MEDQEKTYNILRRIPWEEMDQVLDNLPKSPAPLYQFGNGIMFESRKHEITRHYEKIKCMEEHGWTLEEFVLEAEKRNIIRAIDEFNREYVFPMELVNRAKEFFPNARFTQAKIELE